MQFMDSFHPVTPPDPYDRYRIESVGDQREKETPKGGGGEPPEKKWGLIAKILQKLHGMVSSLLDSFSTQQERQIFRSLKSAFETLKKEDRSEDIQFLNQLSHLWFQLLDEGNQLTYNPRSSSLLKELIKKIERYPERQTHTFGYYLSEFAGQKWIPFPYMELIQKLHFEHLKYPEMSALAEWTRLLDDLLLKVE